MLKGKLTYSVAVIAILFGAIGWWFGWLEPQMAWEFVLGGMGGIGLRRALPSSD